MRIEFWVPGDPSGQGSKRGFVRGGKVAMVDTNKNLQPWRDSITWKAIEARRGRVFEGPVKAELTFVFARPKSHYGTGRNAGVLKPNQPLYKVSKPDLDKLERAALDAFTASGVYGDDAQVVMMRSSKQYGQHGMLVVALSDAIVT